MNFDHQSGIDVEEKILFRIESHVFASLRSRRLEVAGERENGRARGRHARVSFSRARFFLCPLLPSACYYFQAPATQATVSRAKSFRASEGSTNSHD